MTVNELQRLLGTFPVIYFNRKNLPIAPYRLLH